MRAFIAVEVPKTQREAIWSIVAALLVKPLPVKWVSLENLHITLKFLSEIDERRLAAIQPVLRDIARQRTQFTARLAGLGCFPSVRSPRVLWVGVADGAEPMTELAGVLDQELYRYDFMKEERPFHPHLTFGRAKTPVRIEGFFDRQFETEPFNVAEFVLFKSTLRPEGPLYEVLDRFPLG